MGASSRLASSELYELHLPTCSAGWPEWGKVCREQCAKAAWPILTALGFGNLRTAAASTPRQLLQSWDLGWDCSVEICWQVETGHRAPSSSECLPVIAFMGRPQVLVPIPAMGSAAVLCPTVLCQTVCPHIHASK